MNYKSPAICKWQVVQGSGLHLSPTSYVASSPWLHASAPENRVFQGFIIILFPLVVCHFFVMTQMVWYLTSYRSSTQLTDTPHNLQINEQTTYRSSRQLTDTITAHNLQMGQHWSLGTYTSVSQSGYAQAICAQNSDFLPVSEIYDGIHKR